MASPVRAAQRACSTRLLVSVRSEEEAEEALAGGAHLIDVKEPGRGPLGRADEGVIRAVVRRVAGRAPVSAALGELAQQPGLPSVLGLAYVKWGLAGWPPSADWQRALLQQSAATDDGNPLRVVAVAYADGGSAGAPSVEEVCRFACRRPGGVLLLDTYFKGPHPVEGRPLNLLDWLPLPQVMGLCASCRAAGVRVALAGSLGPEQVEALLAARPDWIAVRGAACDGGRGGRVSTRKVRELVGLLATG